MSHTSSRTVDFIGIQEDSRSAICRTASDLIRPMVTAILSRHVRRRDAKILAQLDDRMLRDIGMCRSEIDGLIRGSW